MKICLFCALNNNRIKCFWSSFVPLCHFLIMSSARSKLCLSSIISPFLFWRKMFFSNSNRSHFPVRKLARITIIETLTHSHRSALVSTLTNRNLLPIGSITNIDLWNWKIRKISLHYFYSWKRTDKFRRDKQFESIQNTKRKSFDCYWNRWLNFRSKLVENSLKIERQTDRKLTFPIVFFSYSNSFRDPRVKTVELFEVWKSSKRNFPICPSEPRIIISIFFTVSRWKTSAILMKILYFGTALKETFVELEQLFVLPVGTTWTSSRSRNNFWSVFVALSHRLTRKYFSSVNIRTRIDRKNQSFTSPNGSNPTRIRSI